MAGTGKRLVTAAGKRRLSPAGKQIPHGTTDDPCGCCGCPDCEYCLSLGQVTPCKVLLTISGLTLCPGCLTDILAGQWASWAVGADFNGSYCLLQSEVGGACSYVGDASGPVLNIYSDASCTTLIKAISNWTVTIGPIGPPIGFSCLLEGTEADGTRVIVNAPAFTTFDCVDPSTAHPTGGACGGGVNLGNAGGTWTVTPNGC